MTRFLYNSNLYLWLLLNGDPAAGSAWCVK